MSRYTVKSATPKQDRGYFSWWDYHFPDDATLCLDKLRNDEDDEAGDHRIRVHFWGRNQNFTRHHYLTDDTLDSLITDALDTDSTLAGMVLDRLLEVGPPEVVAWLESKLSTVEV